MAKLALDQLSTQPLRDLAASAPSLELLVLEALSY